MHGYYLVKPCSEHAAFIDQDQGQFFLLVGVFSSLA